MGSEEITKAEKEAKATSTPPSANSGNVLTREYGVWRLVELREPIQLSSFFRDRLISAKDMVEILPHIVRFYLEVWKISWFWVLVWGLCQVFDSMQNALGLYVTAKLLDTMQVIVVEKRVDPVAVRNAFALKLTLGLAQWAFGRLRTHCNNTLNHRIALQFGKRFIDAYTRMDYTTANQQKIKTTFETYTSETVFCDGMWETAGMAVTHMLFVVEVASQGLFLLARFKEQKNGSLLAFMCLAGPLTKWMVNDINGLSNVWFAYAYHTGFLRLKGASKVLANDRYRKELIGSNLAGFFRDAYTEGLKSLNGVSWANLWQVKRDSSSGITDLISVFLDDIAVVFYLVTVILDPTSFSLTSFAVMKETTEGLAWTIYRMLEDGGMMKKSVESLRDYYEFLEIADSMKDGDAIYPSKAHSNGRGMKIEFRNVSMQYPGGETLALDDVSFIIPAGAIVVLVGENGSGKTTTTSLINRLIEPTSGTILIDDLPVPEYNTASVRDHQAILCQDYQHFPLSVAENIGIGHPPEIDNVKLIREAARHGQALEVVEEITKKKNGKNKAGEPEEDGWSATVRPARTWMGSWQLTGSKLEEMSKTVEKKVELSGGQWQRLALSRLFMRVGEKRKDISLIVTDEPSAALDPHAEYEIFQRLRTLGENRTRIFITHRFGHLTKHADLILCLKKGKLAEWGKHEDLMKAGGEYAKLYNVQAQAFS